MSDKGKPIWTFYIHFDESLLQDFMHQRFVTRFSVKLSGNWKIQVSVDWKLNISVFFKVYTMSFSYYLGHL